MPTILAPSSSIQKARTPSDRGAAYYEKGEYDLSIADSTRAIELEPKAPEPYINRGAAFRKKGDLDRALADFERALELNPKDASALTHRGQAYRDKGNYDRAIADLTCAIELNPKYATALAHRGLAYRDKGNYDRAIADLTRATEFDPTYANSYRHRGVAHLKTGKLYLARADLEKALSLEPDEQLKRSVASTRGVAMSRGLARIARPEGLIVAYATQSGNVAEDGSGRNSPFTAALLQNIETPGLEVGTLFRRVMGSVKQATNGKQHSELSVLFDGEFYFKPGS